MNNTIYNQYTISNSEFYNNICEYPAYILATGINNHLYNNIFTIGSTNHDGNKFGIVMSDVFVGSPNSFDGYFRLKPLSPASGAGYGGVDCGMFGNTEHYVLSGIPALPHIYDAKVENSGSSGTGLPVHLKAKSLN
jgi:hypothetical protein